MVQRDGFAAAEASVELDIALTRRLGAGFVGGAGFILQRLRGPGIAFIHAGGDFVEFDLEAGETLQLDMGCRVCFDETVVHAISWAGGIATSIFRAKDSSLQLYRNPDESFCKR